MSNAIAPRIVRMNRSKETPNKVVFKEESQPGQPPVVESIYLPKWIVGEAATVELTVKVVG